jgi:hypothetical protein
LIHDSNQGKVVQRVADWLDRQLQTPEASVAKDDGFRSIKSRNL